MVPFLTEMLIYLYETWNKGSTEEGHIRVKKKLGPSDHPCSIIQYPMTCYVANMMRPSGAVVITPD